MSNRQIRVGLTYRTIVSRELALWTSPVELDTADTTQIIVGQIPSPRGHGVVGENFDLHTRRCRRSKAKQDQGETVICGRLV